MTNLDDHIFLSAGAGTGKTHVLVQRYLEFLRTGRASVPEIVCVTFTEKAAGELKGRIRRECEEAASDRAQSSTWQRHKRDLENAPINTIHGFCARLLRTHALAAGIDPKCQVMDERETQQLREEISREFVLERLRAESSPDMLFLIGRLGMRGLLALFRDALSRSQGITIQESESLADAAHVSERWRRFRERSLNRELAELSRDSEWLDAVSVFRSAVCLDADNAFAGQRQAGLAALDALLNEGSALHERLASARELTAIRVPPRLSAKHWDRPAKLKAAFATTKARVSDLPALATVPAEAERSSQDFSLAFSREHRLLLHAFQRAKQGSARLDFDDLQLETLRLLRESSSIARSCRREFRAFLVDEFQDTDETQKEILWRLAGLLPGDDGGPVANVFVVGDAKQSVYRFRGADVTVFNRTEREFDAPAGEQKLELSRNFRTHDELLDFVNEVFLSPAVMGGGEPGALHHARYAALVPDRQCTSTSPSVELLLSSPSGDGGSDAETLRIREAGMIAERIAQLVQEQPFEIEEGDDGGNVRRTPLSWKHFAILFRAMSDVALYERALRQWGVPYYVVAGRGLYERQEVRDLLNFLKAIENLRDEVALAGVLRSPFFGVNDRSLYWLCQGASLSSNLAVLAGRLARERGLGVLGKIEDQEAEKIRRADRAMRHFRRIKDRIRLGALVEAIVTETGFTSALLSGDDGEQKVSNLRKLAELARSLEQSSALSVCDFIRTVEDLVVREEREGEAPTREEESDVVKLLTIHKAKGLEWPVVVVPDISREPRLHSGESFLTHPELGTVLKGEDSAGETHWPAVGQILRAEEEDKEIAEHRRLLYVAVTRARDHLILSGSLGRSGSAGSGRHTWLLWLTQALGLDDHLGKEVLAGGEPRAWRAALRMGGEDQPRGEQALCTSEPAAPVPAPDLASVQSRLSVFEPDTSRRHRLTVTELDEYDSCPHRFYLKRVRDLAEYHWTAAGAAGLELSVVERGTLAHRAVQKLLAARDVELEVLVEDCLQEEGIAPAEHADSSRDICKMLSRFQQAELWPRLLGAERVETEVPFSIRVPVEPGEDETGVVVEGAIDVIGTGSDGETVLVDFKTGSGRSEKYGFQIGIYVLAVEAMRGAAPATAALYYLDRGRTELFDVQKLLSETRGKLDRAIRGILEAEFDRPLQVDCSGCGLSWTCEQQTER